MSRVVDFVVLACGCIVPGCLGLGSGTPEPRSYVLAAVARPPATMTTASAQGEDALTAVGIAPVSVPRFLDRPQIVTLGPGNEVKLAELDRWAEPLADGVTRVLAANLAVLLPGTRVERYPWPAQIVPTLEVRADVLRLDGDPSGKCAVELRWSLLGKGRLVSGVSRQEMQAAAASHGALVAAWSQLLALAAAEIATAIAQQRG